MCFLLNNPIHHKHIFINKRKRSVVTSCRQGESGKGMMTLVERIVVTSITYINVANSSTIKT
ncbi:MAG: hypothetical protein ACI358_03920 [Candidatus Limimorpha sp.]